tara:strand:- start:844 stop:1428 length:585 start_codon:yes stop_codon:yes gene_type:complete
MNVVQEETPGIQLKYFDPQRFLKYLNTGSLEEKNQTFNTYQFALDKMKRGFLHLNPFVNYYNSRVHQRQFFDIYGPEKLGIADSLFWAFTGIDDRESEWLGTICHESGEDTEGSRIIPYEFLSIKLSKMIDENGVVIPPSTQQFNIADTPGGLVLNQVGYVGFFRMRNMKPNQRLNDNSVLADPELKVRRVAQR